MCSHVCSLSGIIPQELLQGEPLFECQLNVRRCFSDLVVWIIVCHIVKAMKRFQREMNRKLVVRRGQVQGAQLPQQRSGYAVYASFSKQRALESTREVGGMDTRMGE